MLEFSLVLFKAISLTIPFLFGMQHVKIGDIYEDSKVVRVDRGLGLLLEIPSVPVSTPAYVSVCIFVTLKKVIVICQFLSLMLFLYI